MVKQKVKGEIKTTKEQQNVKADQNVNHLAKAIEISLDNLQTEKYIKSLLITFLGMNMSEL